MRTFSILCCIGCWWIVMRCWWRWFASECYPRIDNTTENTKKRRTISNHALQINIHSVIFKSSRFVFWKNNSIIMASDKKKTPTVSYRIIFVFLSRLDIALLFTWYLNQENSHANKCNHHQRSFPNRSQTCSRKILCKKCAISTKILSHFASTDNCCCQWRIVIRAKHRRII